MAVFTPVTPEEAAKFIEPLNLGKLTSLRGIPTGIENTNYFLTTDSGEFVLTLFERITAAELEFYLQLMRHLANKGIPVPEPKENGNSEIVFELNGKPAAVVSKLEGWHSLEPGQGHCAQVAEMLARMHKAGVDFKLKQANFRGFDWWFQTGDKVAPFLDKERRHILFDELKFQMKTSSSSEYQSLPTGPIHGDLFRDNVLFTNPRRDGESSDDDKLSGFFDYYFAGTDILMLDVAVCLNDWCINRKDGTLVQPMVTTFLEAYERGRPVVQIERDFLPAMLRAAALRFWLSRLSDWHFPRESTMLQAYDPEHFYRILCSHRTSPLVLMSSPI